MEQPAKKLMVFFLNVSLLCFVCKTSETGSFQAVELGNTVTITCYIYDEARIRVWYKLTTKGRLQTVASTDTLYNLTTFKKPFEHYVVKSDHTSSHLTISSTTWEDAGTYYCGVMKLQDIQFGSGTFLLIKGANMVSDSVIRQPDYKSVHPGDSVTLSCSVHTDHCAAEHTSITWLKTSHYSAPERIFSFGNEKNSFRRTKHGETASVYNLDMRNLSFHDAGTYYCAVMLCGQMLFGNGTRIHIDNGENTLIKSTDLSPTVITLILTNIVLGLATLLLAWTVCKKKKESTASRSGSGSSGANQTEDAVTYSAVYAAPRHSSSKSAPVKCSRDTTVYSDLNYCK